MTEIFPWLSTIWQQLINYKCSQKIPSGLLLSGVQGIGKEPLAMRFAQYFLCRGDTKIDACGNCKSCKLFLAGSHPDFFRISPEEKSHVIKIEQIRNLTDALTQTSFLGGYQIVIISLAEQMNKAAANSLLKTLEEPSGHVLILLLSHQPTSVPATILSRCQHVKIPLPKTAEVEAWLSTQSTPNSTVKLALSLADYIPLRALDFLKQEKQKLRDNLLVHLKQVQRGLVEPIVAAASCLTLTEEQVRFLMTLTLDMIKIKFSTNGFLTHHDKLSELSELCSQWSVAQLYKFLDLLFETFGLLTHQNNVNAQLLMEKIFINWRYKHDVN
jgi:DNA polymerase-3 subunit delta'